MKLFRTSFLAVMGMFAFALQAQAQNCAELYQRATALKNNKSYVDAIGYYQRAMACDGNLRADCNKWIKFCRNRLPVLELSQQEIKYLIREVIREF